MFETKEVLLYRYPFNIKQQIIEPDWEIYLRETGQKMVSEQSPKALLEVRARIYELLTHCIPPELIIKVDKIYKCNVVPYFITFFSIEFAQGNPEKL